MGLGQIRRDANSGLMSSPATTAAPARNALMGIAPFTLIIFLVYLTIGMPLAALPLQVHDVLGFDTVTVGITIGLQSLVTILTRQFAGTLCDRRGAKFGMHSRWRRIDLGQRHLFGFDGHTVRPY